MRGQRHRIRRRAVHAGPPIRRATQAEVRAFYERVALLFVQPSTERPPDGRYRYTWTPNPERP